MGFIDLHCHPLPGIDDGVRSADEGAALLVALKRAGFDTVVATPHVRSGVWDNRADTRAAARAVAGARTRPGSTIDAAKKLLEPVRIRSSQSCRSMR